MRRAALQHGMCFLLAGGVACQRSCAYMAVHGTELLDYGVLLHIVLTSTGCVSLLCSGDVHGSDIPSGAAGARGEAIARPALSQFRAWSNWHSQFMFQLTADICATMIQSLLATNCASRGRTAVLVPHISVNAVLNLCA